MRRVIGEAAAVERMPPMVFETKYYVCQCFRLWSNPKKGTNLVKCMHCQSKCPKAFNAKEIKIEYHCQDCGHKWKCREFIWGEKWCRCGQAGIPDRDFWNDLYYPVLEVVKLIRKRLANHHNNHDWGYFYRKAIDELYNIFVDL